MPAQDPDVPSNRFISLIVYPISVFSAIGFGLGLSGVVLANFIINVGGGIEVVSLVIIVGLLSNPVIGGLIGIHLAKYEPMKMKFAAIFFSILISSILSSLLIIITNYLGMILLDTNNSQVILEKYVVPILLIGFFTAIVSITIGYNHSRETDEGAANILKDPP